MKPLLSPGGSITVAVSPADGAQFNHGSTPGFGGVRPMTGLSAVKTREIRPIPGHGRKVPQPESVHPEAPTVGDWSERFCSLVIDVDAGRREPRSLRRWMSNELYATFARRIELVPKPTKGSVRAVTVSSRLCQAGPGAYEVACTIWDRGQLRAVAVRVKEFRGRWLAVALEYG